MIEKIAMLSFAFKYNGNDFNPVQLVLFDLFR